MILLDAVFKRKVSPSLVIMEAFVVTVAGAAILGFVFGRQGVVGVPVAFSVYPFIFMSVYYYTTILKKRIRVGQKGDEPED